MKNLLLQIQIFDEIVHFRKTWHTSNKISKDHKARQPRSDESNKCCDHVVP
jgi:hypothetical protein